jgi:CRP-like cAMP-binding protein
MAAGRVTAESQCLAGPLTNAANLAGRIDLISTSPLFENLSQQVIEKIARMARPKAIARDEVLYMQGQPVRMVALMRTGSMKISQLARNGNEVILWIYGSGSVLGTLTDPTSSCYTCSARALEHSTALIWDYSAIQALMLEYPQIRKNAGQILAVRLDELEERFREVATEKVAKRVALALLRLLKHVGKTVSEGIEVSLSREELAQMTGTTLFTISRLLSKWNELGYVLPRREAVIVRDIRKLEQAEDDDLESVPLISKGERSAARGRISPLGIFGSSALNNGDRETSEAPC